jgi:hypothetical protein
LHTGRIPRELALLYTVLVACAWEVVENVFEKYTPDRYAWMWHPEEPTKNGIVDIVLAIVGHCLIVVVNLDATRKSVLLFWGGFIILVVLFLFARYKSYSEPSTTMQVNLL